MPAYSATAVRASALSTPVINARESTAVGNGIRAVVNSSARLAKWHALVDTPDRDECLMVVEPDHRDVQEGSEVAKIGGPLPGEAV